MQQIKSSAIVMSILMEEHKWFALMALGLKVYFFQLKQKWQSFLRLPFESARDWNRTSTSLRTADFESAASTNSATRA